MTYEYYPSGVCSRRMIIELDGDIITGLKVDGGCNGNLQGIAALVKGMDIDSVIDKLKDIRCGVRPTSCPAQLAKALEKIKEEQ
ncbi:MAG: TIGR03905 family TSCPD domain-containing protein [Oscillospiraceae bacterium]|nr:TIGR03905 family TSCPD domain-containing protein [Oscillospiraceae bacterium]